MAKFRVEFDGSFDNEADAIAFFNLIEQWKTKIWTSLPDDRRMENSFRGRYHECFHDEDPAKQCGNYVNIDFKDPIVVEHTTKLGEVMKVSADNTEAVSKAELAIDLGKLNEEIKP